MPITELKSLTEIQEKIAHSTKTLVIDWTSLWCAPCSMIMPKLEKLSLDYSGVSFYKVNVDAVSDAAEYYNITAMPTILFYKNGELVDKVVGADYKKIKNLVAKYA